jgi:hypothetical protein
MKMDFLGPHRGWNGRVKRGNGMDPPTKKREGKPIRGCPLLLGKPLMKILISYVPEGGINVYSAELPHFLQEELFLLIRIRR